MWRPTMERVEEIGDMAGTLHAAAGILDAQVARLRQVAAQIENELVVPMAQRDDSALRRLLLVHNQVINAAMLINPVIESIDPEVPRG